MAETKKMPEAGFNKILYVTDLSENSRLAFPYAAAVARRFHAALTVFHVVETEHFEKYLTGYISEEMWDKLRLQDLDEARKVLIDRRRENSVIKENLDKICQESLKDTENEGYVAYDIKIRLGEPADRIVKETEANDYDLIIIGNHGKRSIREALIGSTSRRVLASCRVPVLVVPLPEKR